MFMGRGLHNRASACGSFIFVAVSLLAGAALAQSVRLPDWNCALEDRDPVSFFFQPIEGFSMLGEDGALLISLEMPRGETKTLNGQYRFCYYLLGTHNMVDIGDRFAVYFHPQESCFYFAGKARGIKVVVQTQPLALRDGLLDETSLLVIVQRSGDTFSIRAVSGTSGRIYEGETVDAAGYVLDAVRGGNGFAVGTVADAAVNPKLDRARGHSGNLEFAGYSTRTVSDEDARRIALGADPVKTLGEGTLRWYRHFAGAEQKTELHPTTAADKTKPTTVVGREWMVSGGTVRRQSESTYLTLDYIPDGRVWGLTRADQASKPVPLSGAQQGLPVGSKIEVRVIQIDTGEVVQDWTEVATVGADSNWKGSFTMPRSHGWDYLEVRSAARPQLVYRSRSRCGVGYKIAMIGQSENTYLLCGYHGNMRYRSSDGAISLVASGSWNPLFQTHGDPQILIAESWEKLGDGVLAIGRQLREYTDAPICIINLAKSGTGATELVDDDRNEKRKWSQLERKVRLAGRDVSLMHWMWFASDRGYGKRYGNSIFDPVVLGIKNHPKHDAFDHYIYDGTFDHEMIFCPALHWGRCCQEDVLVGDHGFEEVGSLVDCMIGQKAWRETHASGHPDVPHFPPVPQVDFPTGYDIQGDRYHGGHSDPKSPIGPQRIGFRVGEYLARVLGLSNSQNPKLKDAWFGKDRSEIFVRFSLPNGGVLRTAAGENVTDVWVSTDGGEMWNMGEHTARIFDPREGIIRLSKNSGTWPEGAKIAYVINRVALKNVDGYLYEGPADGKGIGPLAMEGGLGIPVQPYLPVPHETAVVKVAAERPALENVSSE